MTIDTPVHDFGEIKKGSQVTKVFKFTNTGTGDLVIELVSGCHCSTLVWPEFETFKPGESGEIKVTFDSNKEDSTEPFEKVVDILLEDVDPKTGYQVIKELKYTGKIVE